VLVTQHCYSFLVNVENATMVLALENQVKYQRVELVHVLRGVDGTLSTGVLNPVDSFRRCFNLLLILRYF